MKQGNFTASEQEFKVIVDGGGPDISQIPADQWESFLAVTLEGVERFYSDPRNRERFEKWLAARQAGAVRRVS